MELVNEAVVIVAQMLANELLEDVKRKKKKKKRRLWIRKWISMRDDKGASMHLCRELEMKDLAAYHNLFRVICEQ
jgi:hypothetical protein